MTKNGHNLAIPETVTDFLEAKMIKNRERLSEIFWPSQKSQRRSRFFEVLGFSRKIL